MGTVKIDIHPLYFSRSLRSAALAKTSINLTYTVLSNRLNHSDLNLEVEGKYRRTSANVKTMSRTFMLEKPRIRSGQDDFHMCL